MAKRISTYEFHDLKLNPSEAGYSAAEQAGRRIGPFATQAAAAIRQVANLQDTFDKEAGLQQTSFLRLQGLEEEVANKSGGGVRAARGLKDMFQLGAGGNEPNYARLNRLAELSDTPVNISRAAHDIVHQQSPLTKTSQFSGDLWQLSGSEKQITPNPDITFEDAAKAGFNVDPNPLGEDQSGGAPAFTGPGALASPNPDFSQATAPPDSGLFSGTDTSKSIPSGGIPSPADARVSDPGTNANQTPTGTVPLDQNPAGPSGFWGALLAGN